MLTLFPFIIDNIKFINCFTSETLYKRLNINCIICVLYFYQEQYNISLFYYFLILLKYYHYYINNWEIVNCN